MDNIKWVDNFREFIFNLVVSTYIKWDLGLDK